MRRRAMIVIGLIAVIAIVAAIFASRDDTRPGQPSPHAIDQSQ